MQFLQMSRILFDVFKPKKLICLVKVTFSAFRFQKYAINQ